jgi:hypothetical protein
LFTVMVMGALRELPHVVQKASLWSV